MVCARLMRIENISKDCDDGDNNNNNNNSLLKLSCSKRTELLITLNTILRQLLSKVSEIFRYSRKMFGNVFLAFEQFLKIFRNLVARTISHSFAALTHEILFLPLKHKIHIFSPRCNILYICNLPANVFHVVCFRQKLTSSAICMKQIIGAEI